MVTPRALGWACGAGLVIAAASCAQIFGLDQPGLVHEVANILRGHGVNIETMDTKLEAAPETGAPIWSSDQVHSRSATSSSMA